MIYCIAHYSFTYQYIKPSLWLYRRPFPPNLCCWWAIKILLNRQTKNTRFVCWPLYLPPTTNIVCPIHKTYNMIHLLIFIFPLENDSTPFCTETLKTWVSSDVENPQDKYASTYKKSREETSITMALVHHTDPWINMWYTRMKSKI